ncbi:competence/damage-inducible protein A [Aquisalibacillus elongatus]|uniref:Putative competence-damage inducible protein n=1 Tax=Aquisalibacillus elongatus TaxID=485577 RepID=A0A3N5CB31_9BACI|nr:competence/damage-inducible protein A [Aquisalibacillus elongatus]RPF55925.1 competence/damage-inducible protein cinA [Aquisalibacillus elongatus]
MIHDTKCEIITVGTELLLGQIVDTNSAWLSERLASAGINVYFKQTVGDNEHRLFSVFEKAQSRSNIIFVTGGLGPTDDDLTKDVAAKLFQTNLMTHSSTMDKIETFFKKRNLQMTENNRKQALGFEGGKVFKNEVGMAPGLFFEHDGTWWFFVPGVPKEMKYLMNEQIMPYLKEQGVLTEQLYNRVLSFQGIGESTLETELHGLIRQQTNPTIAPLAKDGYVTLRLTAKAKTIKEANQLLDPTEEKIMNRVGSHFIGYGPVSLEEQLKILLEEHNLTLSSCESVTGGLFSSTMVSLEGASSFFNGSIVSYSNDAKEQVVGVSKEVITQHGAVSEPCAKQMAHLTRDKLQSDLSISFTGVAGDEVVDGHSPGTVFIGISANDHAEVDYVQIKGDRQTIREEAATEGIKRLIKFIKNFIA